MAKYQTMAPKDYDTQSAKWRAVNPTLAGLERSHLAQKKYDGCHMLVRISSDGHGEAFSRTGEIVNSCDHIIQAVARVYGPGWVVAGEVWKDNTTFPEISGMYRRHNAEPTLKFVPFDIIPASSYAIGVHDVPYMTRFKHLTIEGRRSAFPGSPLQEVQFYPPGTYGDPQQLANRLVEAGGSDGAILWSLDGHWIKDEAKAGQCIKIKPVLSFDLKVVGVEEGKGKMAGMAGALLVNFRGKVCRASGGDYPTRTAWLKDIASIVDKIVEVECLGITEDGLLREPRIKAVRFDKLTAD